MKFGPESIPVPKRTCEIGCTDMEGDWGGGGRREGEMGDGNRREGEKIS